MWQNVILSLLRFVVPQTFFLDANEVMCYNLAAFGHMFLFVSRPLILIVGADCFLIRFRAIAVCADTDPPAAFSKGFMRWICVFEFDAASGNT